MLRGFLFITTVVRLKLPGLLKPLLYKGPDPSSRREPVGDEVKFYGSIHHLTFAL